MKNDYAFKVPDQLYPAVDDHVLEVHNNWQNYTRRDVLNMMPDSTEVAFGDQTANVVVLDPRGEIDETSTGIIILPFQQAWKPSMFVRAKIDQEINMPNNRVIVIPQNSTSEKYFSLTSEQMQQLDVSGLDIVYEHFARMISAAGVDGRAVLHGDSFGGLAAYGIAGVGSLDFEVAAINGDEPPNKDRSEKALTKDFMASGGWSMQKHAVGDSGIPSLMEISNTPAMALDYARFGLASLTHLNKLIKKHMAAPHFAELVRRALIEYPDSEVRVSTYAKTGYVQDSKMFDPEVVAGIPGIELAQYDGPASHAHSTMDNPMASALSKKLVKSVLSAE